MDLDLTLWVDPPPTLMDQSSSNDKRDWQKWNHSNCKSLMIMKCAIIETFSGISFMIPHLR